MSRHQPSTQADGYADALTDAVREEIAAVLDLMITDVRPHCQLRRDFGAQPNDFDVFRWAFEKRWGIFVPIEAPAGWLCVSDVIAYIEMRQQRGAAVVAQSPADRITG